MPYGRKNKNTTRASKKYYRRRFKKVAKRNYRRYRKSKSLLLKPVFPSSKIVKMRYVQSCGDVTTAVGAIGTHRVFRCNSAFDPDYTGAGHTPTYYNTIANFYNKAIVLGAKITATFYHNTSTSTGNMPMAFIKKDDDASLSSVDPVDVMEGMNGTVKWRRLRQSVASSIGQTTITSYYSPRKDFNVKDPQDNKDLVSNPSAVPVAVKYWILGIMDLETVTVTDVKANVVIDYVVKFYDIKDYL